MDVLQLVIKLQAAALGGIIPSIQQQQMENKQRALVRNAIQIQLLAGFKCFDTYSFATSEPENAKPWIKVRALLSSILFARFRVFCGKKCIEIRGQILQK